MGLAAATPQRGLGNAGMRLPSPLDVGTASNGMKPEAERARYRIKRMGNEWCAKDSVTGRPIAWAPVGNRATPPVSFREYVEECEAAASRGEE